MSCWSQYTHLKACIALMLHQTQDATGARVAPQRFKRTATSTARCRVLLQHCVYACEPLTLVRACGNVQGCFGAQKHKPHEVTTLACTISPDPGVTTDMRGLTEATSTPPDIVTTAAVSGRGAALDVCVASSNVAATRGARRRRLSIETRRTIVDKSKTCECKASFIDRMSGWSSTLETRSRHSGLLKQASDVGKSPPTQMETRSSNYPFATKTTITRGLLPNTSAREQWLLSALVDRTTGHELLLLMGVGVMMWTPEPTRLCLMMIMTTSPPLQMKKPRPLMFKTCKPCTDGSLEEASTVNGMPGVRPGSPVRGPQRGAVCSGWPALRTHSVRTTGRARRSTHAGTYWQVGGELPVFCMPHREDRVTGRIVRIHCYTSCT